MVARAPTGIPAHTALRAKRFAPDSAQNAPQTTRSPVRTRSQADASQKPYRARAVRRRVWWRAHRPAYQPTPRYAPSASRQKPPRSRMRQIAEAANRGCGKSRMRQIADAANRGSGKSRMRQIAEAANRGSGKSRIHPNTTEKRTATDIVSQRQKASGRQEANRVLINKNRCLQQDSSSTPAASRARRSLGPAPSLAAAQYGAYPATPSYPATPGLLSDTSDIQRYQRHSAIHAGILFPALF